MKPNATRLKRITLKQEWLLRLLSDNERYTKTAKALRPLIKRVGLHLEDKNDQQKFQKVMEAGIPDVANIYLSHILKNKKFRFDVYFTWYLAQTVNKMLEEQEKQKTVSKQ